MRAGFRIEDKSFVAGAPIETAAFRSLVAEAPFFERLVHERGHLERVVRLVFAVCINVIDDRLVYVPADQIDGRKRRHRAPRMRADQVVDKRDAVLGGELRGFVKDLEADTLAA